MRNAARLDELRAAGELQRRLCHDNGSPTYAGIIEVILDRLETADPAVELLLADRRPAVESALYLRLLGAVHRIAFRDPACPLRSYLPSTGGVLDIPRAVAAFHEVVASTAEVIEQEMRVNVQTNEVGRSAPLSAAFNYLSAPVPAPLRLVEVGASAGLNLWPDRYFVDAGTTAWGPPDSAVQLDGQFIAGIVPAPGFRVESRRGCDLQPIRLDDARSRQVLRSFIWPEQVNRLRRLDAALSVASPVPIDQADAVTWAEEVLRELPAGATTVLFHSITLNYMSKSQRVEFARVVRRAGERAGRSSRLAWVAFEPTADYSDVWLVCEQWPERSRVRLARANPHGAEINWAPTPLSVEHLW